MTEAIQTTPRTLAAIIDTELGTIISTNTDPKQAREYRLSVRELNGSINGTKFMVVEFTTTGTNLSYYLNKFQTNCDSTKNQLRIWNYESFILGKQRLLNSAQETLNNLLEAQEEVSELFNDHARKNELIGDLITDEIREVQEEVAEIETDISQIKSTIAKLQATVA